MSEHPKDTPDFACMSYDKQLATKVNQLTRDLTPFLCESTPPVIDIFTSEERHYRQRAEFRIWHHYKDCQGNEKHDMFYSMYQPGTKETYAITDFPAASKAINELMQPLLDRLKSQEILYRKLFRVEFLNTLSGEMLVTLVYHKPLDEKWQRLAQKIHDDFGILLIGRSRKQKLIFGKDFVDEQLNVDGTIYHSRQFESTFTQPNAKVNEKMLSWALQQAQRLKGVQQTDLLELYCGNGNFTFPLSSTFNKVFTTEISKGSIRALNWGTEKNNITHLEHARLSAEEVSIALKGTRKFRRLADIDLDSYCFSTVFVDPPRAGIDDQTLEFIAGFQRIIYISCNPVTLVENLQKLQTTHQVSAYAAFDQFPFTAHLEAGVLLEKNCV